MKRLTLCLLAFSACLLTAGYLLGQGKSAPAAAAAAPAPAQKLVHVATIKGVDANREFQSNVQLLHAQRQAVLELNTQMEKEKNAKKQKELKAQIDTILAKLNENNDKMQKAYGFSLTRNYTLEIETAHIYLAVSEEEAAKFEQEAAKAEKAKKTKTGKK
jgi:hypothetical protein